MKYLAALCIVLMCGCATTSVSTELGKNKYGPYLKQEVKGKGKSFIEAAKLHLDGKARIDPETGQLLNLEITSGQAVQGLQSSGVDLKSLVDLLRMYQEQP